MASQIRAAKRKKSSYSLEMKLEVYKRLKAGIAPSDMRPSILKVNLQLARSKISPGQKLKHSLSLILI